ncbi:hypothetical protein SDC9_160484 [bioreactor metagenome]|uniref:Uncharacterized protein n=1 Tax=bioreactor metagenome TaxID=1076179 RepID=A0A645FL77_9ZZZZ
MEEAIGQVLAKPDVQEKLAKIYVRADFADGHTLGDQVGKLIQYWTPIVESSGIKSNTN